MKHLWVKTRRAIIAFIALLPMSAHAETPIRLGQVNLSFYAVVGAVVHEVLQAAGYPVEVIEGSHAEIFPQLGAGDVDLLAAAWLPNGHAALFEQVDAVTFRIAPVYDNASFFWVVPDYVPEDVVSSIEDLKKPDVAARMSQEIVSLPEATGLTIGARRVMDAYDLPAADYSLIAGTPSEWVTTFRTAVENKDWVVFPLWQPHWINAVYDVRRLDEPQGAYGSPDTAWLIGHKGLSDKLNAETLSTLSGLRISIADVTEMDRLVNVEGMSARDAARTWMQNVDARATVPSD